MQNTTDYLVHPLSNHFFFESKIPAQELHGSKIFLHYFQRGFACEGIFEIHAHNPPPVPHLTKMFAVTYSYHSTGITTHSIVFDAKRASKVARVRSAEYGFSACLGELTELEQVPEVWESVRRQFDELLQK